MGREDDSDEAPIEVPHELLSGEALRALVEEFVTRDGTDYGRHERSVESKVSEVLALLARGEARIFFDPESRTTTIVPRR